MRALVLAAGAGLALALTSCGPGAQPPTARPVRPGSVADQQAVRRTIKAFYGGIIEGHSAAVCALMTPAERASVATAARAEGGSSCRDWVTETQASDAQDGVMPPVQVGVGTVQIAGNTATVQGSEITIVPAAGLQSNVQGSVSLRRLAGGWRIATG